MAINPCPVCGKPIAIDDINISQGVGLCRACGKLSTLTDIAQQIDIDVATVAVPPAGCSYLPPFAGVGTAIYASLRSPGQGVLLLAFALFWNSIVSVFVLLAISGFYIRFVGPLPHWFPASSGTTQHGHADTGSLGVSIFLCIFLIPFVLVGLTVLGTAIMSFVGRIEVTIDGTFGRVRTGVGPFNWTRNFDPTQVKRVALGKTFYEQNGRSKPTIKIESEFDTINFGSMLTDRRREWLMGVLHLLLVAPGKEARQRQGLSTPIRR